MILPESGRPVPVGDRPLVRRPSAGYSHRQCSCPSEDPEPTTFHSRGHLVDRASVHRQPPVSTRGSLRNTDRQRFDLDDAWLHGTALGASRAAFRDGPCPPCSRPTSRRHEGRQGPPAEFRQVALLAVGDPVGEADMEDPDGRLGGDGGLDTLDPVVGERGGKRLFQGSFRSSRSCRAGSEASTACASGRTPCAERGTCSQGRRGRWLRGVRISGGGCSGHRVDHAA